MLLCNIEQYLFDGCYITLYVVYLTFFYLQDEYEFIHLKFECINRQGILSMGVPLFCDLSDYTANLFL